MVFARRSRGGQTHARRANSYFKIVFFTHGWKRGTTTVLFPVDIPLVASLFFMLSEPARVSAKRAEAIFMWESVQNRLESKAANAPLFLVSHF